MAADRCLTSYRDRGLVLIGLACLLQIFHTYLPNATVRCPIVLFVANIGIKISEVKQGSIGNFAAGYATIYNWRQIAGMQKSCICFWTKRSRKTPLPRAPLATWRLIYCHYIMQYWWYHTLLAKIAFILHCSAFSLLVVWLLTILNNLPIKSPMRGWTWYTCLQMPQYIPR